MAFDQFPTPKPYPDLPAYPAPGRFPDATRAYDDNMLADAQAQQELDGARDYYMSTDAYAPFDVLPDGRHMEGCIDPRADDTPGQAQLTKVQGPGSEAGESSDHSQALTIVQNRLVTLDEAAADDMKLRRASVQGGHRSGCAYVGVYGDILEESANPGGATLRSISKWIADHELDLVDDAVLTRIQEAAGMQLEHLRRTGGIDHILDIVDRAFPEHANVPEMRGEPTPSFYIVNGFPHLGLNRHQKHDVQQQRHQAYHDNVGARLNGIHNTHALPLEARRHRMGALLLRSAATRTVVNRLKRAAGHPLENIEVEIGESGAVFRRVSVN